MSDEKIAKIKTLAVLGGTGKEGSALAKRWALNGYRVIIGSRSLEKARDGVAEMNAELGGDYLTGLANEEAARAADIVVLSVPYSAHKDTLNSVRPHLAGKIVVDLTVPLQPPAVRTVHVPEGKSACLEAQALLGDDVTVIAAFQNVSAEKLKDPAYEVDCDVLVCGNAEVAKAEVIELVRAAGMRGIDAGPLANAVAVEALTPVLLYINKKYSVKGAGVRITGIALQ
ncbi:MAG: NADPH-dependent F420 reductase [Anaerolineae bacterium]|nr:NADPH-dependent F420 reductase [Anaerolineae bacterium]